MGKRTDKDIQPFTELFEDLPDQGEANDERELDKIRIRKRVDFKKADKELVELEQGEKGLDEFFAKLSAEKELDAELYKALQFLFSQRGKYVMAQALHHAIETMKAVPAPRTEHSDISDMEFIRDKLFKFPIRGLKEAEDKFRRMMKQKDAG